MYKNNLDFEFKLELVDKKPEKNDFAFILSENKVLNKDLSLPTFAELGNTEDLKTNYLFTQDNKNFYMVFGEVNNSDLEKNKVRDFFKSKNDQLISNVLACNHLRTWYNTQKFCGKCGSHFSNSKTERALVCDDCKTTVYPTISPAVIIGLINKDKILLSKYAVADFSSYALLAGYAEVGESLEECVAREVFEEVGLKVKNIRYYKSQPWGLTSTLLSGYFAELEGENNIILDKTELKEATWFKREDLPAEPHSASLTWEMIEYFKNNKL